MLIAPKVVQSAMITSGLGTSPAMVGGFRKIPLPIVIPTISAVPPANPMTRRRSCDSGCNGVVGMRLRLSGRCFERRGHQREHESIALRFGIPENEIHVVHPRRRLEHGTKLRRWSVRDGRRPNYLGFAEQGAGRRVEMYLDLPAGRLILGRCNRC